MNVLRAYLKMIPAHVSYMMMYMGILIGMMLISITAQEAEGGELWEMDLEDFSIDAAVFDEDGSPESKALVRFIEENSKVNVVEVEPEDVQDNLFYRRIDYALTINSGFGKNLKSGNTDGLLSANIINNSTSAAFFGSELNSYISAVSLYLKGGYDSETAAEEAAKKLNDGIELKSYQRENGWKSENSTSFYYFNWMPYILLLMMLQTLTPTFANFMNSDLRSRTLCSPISPVSYTAQIMAGSVMICLGAMVILLGAGMALTGGKLADFLFGYSTLQMFVFMLFCVAIALLVGVLCSGAKKNVGFVSSIVSNVVGLGMAFLCGVFVRQSLLGEQILNVGKLLPAYWYVRANNMIMGADNAVYDEHEVLVCIGIQALFAAAVFAITLLISGIKKGKKSQ